MKKLSNLQKEFLQQSALNYFYLVKEKYESNKLYEKWSEKTFIELEKFLEKVFNKPISEIIPGYVHFLGV